MDFLELLSQRGRGFLFKHVGYLPSLRLSERGQEKGVASVLDSENGEEEAVKEEQDGAPSKDHQLLGLEVGNPRGLDDERDGGE